MREERHDIRSRSDAEVAFAVMRALATVRVLWRRSGGLELATLSELAQAPADAVAVTVDRLCDEGLVERPEHEFTVRLTERGAREMCAEDGDLPSLRRAV